MSIIDRIEQFINESATGKITLYRGHGPDNDRDSENSPFLWFSFEREHAKRYADFKGGETLETIEYRPENALDMGRSEQRMSIRSFLARAISESDVNLKAVKSRAMKLRGKLIDRYGDTSRPIAKYWYADEDVAAFIELLGFDSILTTERGVETLGILRRYVR